MSLAAHDLRERLAERHLAGRIRREQLLRFELSFVTQPEKSDDRSTRAVLQQLERRAHHLVRIFDPQQLQAQLVQQQQIPRPVGILQGRPQIVHAAAGLDRHVPDDRLRQRRIHQGYVERTGLRLVERKLGGPGLDVAAVDQLGFVGLLPVDERAVATPRIANEPTAFAPLDDRVHPGTQRVVEHDAAIQTPADQVLPSSRRMKL